MIIVSGRIYVPGSQATDIRTGGSTPSSAWDRRPRR
jgi:hypothetical protein